MAKIRTLIVAVLGAVSAFLFITSDKFHLGFCYCDKCYRIALTNMRDVMVDEMREAQKEGNIELVKGYSKCISRLDVILEHIGEYHEEA